MDRLNFNPFPTLSTKRLLLREPLIEDAERITELRSNDYVNKYIDRPAHSNLSDSRAFLEKINNGIRSNNWIYWVLCFPDEQELIGTICLWNFTEEPFAAEVGFELLPQYHRQGLITEAMQVIIDFGFNRIGLNQIDAFTHSENNGAIKTLEKFNFKFIRHSEQNHSILNIPYVANIYRLNCHE